MINVGDGSEDGLYVCSVTPEVAFLEYSQSVVIYQAWRVAGTKHSKRYILSYGTRSKQQRKCHNVKRYHSARV